MKGLQFKSISRGVWEIVGRGTIQRTADGWFLVSSNSPRQWTKQEMLAIGAYIDEVAASKRTGRPAGPDSNTQ